MSEAAFRHDVRALLCEQCGAPLRASPDGGPLTCGYCGAAHTLAPRAATRAVTDDRPPLSEDDRLAALRRQDPPPPSPPPSLAPLFRAGNLAPGREEEAFAVWNATRREVRLTGSPDAAERLLLLTLALLPTEADDPARQRALLESALDGLSLPRHRQIVLAALSRQAVRAGDLRAAKEWLDDLDPRPLDLESDSAFRLAAAYLATARREARQVLHLLGATPDEVPLAAMVRLFAVLLRANAHERLGDRERAIAALRDAMHDPGARRAIPQIIAANAVLDLCPTSFRAARAAHDDEAARVAGGSLGGLGVMLPIGALLLLGVGATVGAWLAGVLPAEALPGMIGGMGLPGVIFVALGRWAIRTGREAARLRREGIEATGEILGIGGTGTEINGEPLVAVRLRVHAPDRAPFEAQARVLRSGLAGADVGDTVGVRVDPKDPSRVLVETS